MMSYEFSSPDIIIIIMIVIVIVIVGHTIGEDLADIAGKIPLSWLSLWLIWYPVLCMKSAHRVFQTIQNCVIL